MMKGIVLGPKLQLPIRMPALEAKHEMDIEIKDHRELDSYVPNSLWDLRSKTFSHLFHIFVALSIIKL